MVVLILGSRDDDHAAHVALQLKTRGVRAEFLESWKFPEEIRVAFDPANLTGSLTLPGGVRLGFDEVSAVYWRNYGGTAPIELPDAEQAYIAQNDARGLFESLLIALPVRWVNGWEAFQLHQTKPAALARVAALGLPVPATLLGNDPEAVRAFVAEHDEVIFKPVQGGAHTQIVTPEHLTDENLRKSLALAPVTLQERVHGTDIRMFLAGERVAACAIVTEAVDFRDDPQPRFEQVTLPDEVVDHCRRAAAALHLLWTGIDLRRTDDCRYIFLEANPSPMFLGFEHYTGLPLSEMLLDLLTAPAA